MNNYTKLFKSIVTSTIWQEDDKTRILWITMLALSEADGTVEGSIPGLAHVAGISLEECEKAINRLSSPDKYSRNKDHDGRRIKEIDGGWVILNRGKYRSHGSRAEYYKEWRKRKKQSEHNCNIATVAQRCKRVAPHSNSNSKSKRKEEKKYIKKEISETALISQEQLKDIEILWNSFAPNGYEIHDIVTRHYHQLCSVIEEGEFTIEELLETIENYKQALTLENSRTVPHQFGHFLLRKLEGFKPGTFDLKRYDGSDLNRNDFQPQRREGLALRL